MKIRKIIAIILCIMLGSSLGIVASAKYQEVKTNTGVYDQTLTGQAGKLRAYTNYTEHSSEVTPKQTTYISFTVASYKIHNTDILTGEDVVNRVGSAIKHIKLVLNDQVTSIHQSTQLLYSLLLTHVHLLLIH